MEKIHHLYWRAGFGLSPREWQARQSLTLQLAVDQLFREAGAVEEAPAPSASSREGFRQMSTEEKEAVLKQERERLGGVNIEWIQRMAGSRHSALRERMALFWHGHFAGQPIFGSLGAQYANTLRRHALGNFRELALAIARDGAMIRFLNNQQNRKEKPNENFARELLELFTIGRGHYTEQDIKEAARAFTGWSSNLAGAYTFRPRFHDYGPKTFMGKAGNFDGADIIDIVLEQRETARFITRKIYRYFVNEQEDEAHIEVLSRQFYESGYEIAPLMRSIFESDWFYAPQNIGCRIKSPVELIVGVIRALDVRFVNNKALLFLQRALGQVVLNPPNVAGWPGGKAWIDNATLMLRLNLPAYIFQLSEVNFRTKDEPEAGERGKAIRRLDATIDTRPLMDLLAGVHREHYHERLGEYFFLKQPSIDFAQLKQYASAGSDWDYANSLAMRLMSLPEYQLC